MAKFIARLSVIGLVASVQEPRIWRSAASIANRCETSATMY